MNRPAQHHTTNMVEVEIEARMFDRILYCIQEKQKEERKNKRRMRKMKEKRVKERMTIFHYLFNGIVDT